MKSRKWTLMLAVVLLAVLTTTGYLAVAAEYGSKDDPLVTLSYINDVLTPEANARIDQIFSEKSAEFDTLLSQKMASIQSEIAKKVGEVGSQVQPSDELVEAVAAAVLEQMGGTSGTEESGWTVLKLQSGKTLTAEVGCEILLRIGSAQCVASGTPGLIDLSTGGDLANGQNLSTNHLYIVTIQGRGIRASGDATILINGDYTIQ